MSFLSTFHRWKTKFQDSHVVSNSHLTISRVICFIELNGLIMKLWWMAFFARYFSPSRGHIGNSVHLQRQRCKQQPKSLIFFAALLMKYNRNKMLFTTFKIKSCIGVVGYIALLLQLKSDNYHLQAA